MLGAIKKWFGFSGGETPPKKSLRVLRAAYDAAQTSEYNARYWKNADSLSADAANSLEVRKTIRERARYEAQESNSWAKGMILTLANNVIGTGPRLAVNTPNKDFNRAVETEFSIWCQAVKLDQQLRTMRLAKVVDGEAFAQLFNKPKRQTMVQLDLRVVECDQISTPIFNPLSPYAVDGIVFDDYGDPVTYHKLKFHPGGDRGGFSADFDEVPADAMIHMFRVDRPGQVRGISELATALPLFAMLREFSLAVLSSAKTAAKLAAVIHTDGSAVSDDGSTYDPEIEPFDAVDIDFDMMTSLPYGWKMSQFKAEQPTTTFSDFVAQILNEIARCLNMPYNIAAGNSAGYNYASGRLDHQTYYKSIEVERREWEINCLDRIFSAWLDEALLIEGYLPELEGVGVPHAWYWGGNEHVDPAKEASGQVTRISGGTTSRTREYAAIGLDVEVEDQRAAEEYGVSVEEYRRALFKKLFSAGAGADAETDDEDEADESREPQSAAA